RPCAASKPEPTARANCAARRSPSSGSRRRRTRRTASTAPARWKRTARRTGGRPACEPRRRGGRAMTTLNRFPLLGLWAEEAARRLGYRKDEAESLGHAYAVLYAIRARGPRKAAEGDAERTRPKKRVPTERLHFGGDDLDVTRDAERHVRGRVGGDRPQTAE